MDREAWRAAVHAESDTTEDWTELIHFRYTEKLSQTGVGCHFLLQGIFPTRNWTRVSRIVGRRFTIWATREVQV